LVVFAQIDPRSLHVVAEVPPFDHCQFDALPSMSKDRRQAFSSALFAMDFGDAADRPVMVAEGITSRYSSVFLYNPILQMNVRACVVAVGVEALLSFINQ
jgi:hypothetical protein